MADPVPDPAAKEGGRPLQSSIALERAFRVDGKRVVVRCTIPARVADEIGMEAMLAAARALIIDIESSQAKVKQLKPGES